ncbi:MAG: PAS domain S-box protein, partial [Proteobacteria bacterium]|nr:PAS domain S-box protein [Pseudomonadota bacterium]
MSREPPSQAPLSGSIFDLAWRHAPAGMLALSMRTGRISAVNDAVVSLLGYDAEEIIGRDPAFLFWATIPSNLKENIFSRSPQPSDTHHAVVRAKSGTPRYLNLSLSGAVELHGEVMKVLYLRAPDVNPHADRLRRSNWTLAAYSASIRAIQHARTIEQIAQDVCAAIVEQPVYVLSWIGLAERSPGLPIRFIAGAGPALSYMSNLKLSWSEEIPEGLGPSGTAIRTGQPQMMGDALNDPDFGLWRQRALSHGIRSTVCVPFQLGEHISGAIMVYGSEPNAFGEQEVALFTDLGRELAGAIAMREQSEKLQQAEGRLQKIISSTFSPIVSVNSRGKISLFNEAAERAFGWTAEEAVGQPLDILLLMEDRAAHGDSMNGFLRSQESNRRMAQSRQVRALRKDGSTFLVEVALSRIDTADGPLVTAIIRDLTQQQELQTRLIQSGKMEAFGQLAGGIAHDFNNLIAIISSSADVISAPDVTSETAHASLRLIARTCERAQALTRRLLVFSRKSVHRTERIDVGAALDELVHVLKRTLGTRIEITAALEPGLHIRVDSGLFHTSLLNLALNARDAMPEGGTLVVGCRRLAPKDGQASGCVEISLQDSGIGMPPEVVQRIFEPFFTTKPIGSGTGLGLAMVYGFAKEAGGSIDVESSPNRGSRFTLTFPQDGPGPEIASSSPPEEMRQLNLRVLLVEDDEDLRKITAIKLERGGFIVDAIPNAETAREVLAQGAAYDILVTDYRLGRGWTGGDLARYAASLKPEMPIIVTSGYMEP